MRVQVTLACTETGDRTYITSKNKRTNPERIELKSIARALSATHFTARQNKQAIFAAYFFLTSYERGR